ncbi:hypothetical protein ACA910_021491 [Epithemia clementina (nom. ined.)]
MSFMAANDDMERQADLSGLDFASSSSRSWSTVANNHPSNNQHYPTTTTHHTSNVEPTKLRGGPRSFQAAVVVDLNQDKSSTTTNSGVQNTMTRTSNRNMIAVLGGEVIHPASSSSGSRPNAPAAGISDSVLFLDCSTMEWREGPRLIVPRYGLAAIVCNFALYAIGGFHSEQCLDTLERISLGDLAASCFSLSPSSSGSTGSSGGKPQPTKITTTTTVIKGKQITTVRKTITHVPAPSSSSTVAVRKYGWTKLTARLSTPREGCSAEAVQNRFILVMGGTSNGRDRLMTVDIIDTGVTAASSSSPSSSGLSNTGSSTSHVVTVTTGPAMCCAHLYGTCAFWNDRLYIVGGVNDQGYRSHTVESLQLSSPSPSSSSGTRVTRTIITRSSGGGSSSSKKTTTTTTTTITPASSSSSSLTNSSLGPSSGTSGASKLFSSSSGACWKVHHTLELLTARSGHAMTAVGSCLIVAGGQGNDFAYLQSGEVLDLKHSVVWQLPDLIVPRYGCSLVKFSTSQTTNSAGSGLLVLGGCSGSKDETEGYEDLSVLLEYLGLSEKEWARPDDRKNVENKSAALSAKQREQIQWERSEVQRVIRTTSKKPCRVSEHYIDEILTDKKLGEGFFGVVYKGEDKEMRTIFAIKMLHPDTLEYGHSMDVKRASDTFHRELDTLNSFRHPNIACLYAYHFSPSERGRHVLLFEMAENGSLDRFWTSDVGRERLSSVQCRIRMALEIFTAIRFLHVGGSGITKCFHRDIKSANICLTRDLTAKVIDCGLAKFVTDEQTNVSISSCPKGTKGYTCPKYDSGVLLHYEEACDIFSFGVVMAELWTGKLQNHRSETGNRAVNFHDKYVIQQNPPFLDIDLLLDLHVTSNGTIGEDIETCSLGSRIGDFYDSIPEYLLEFAYLAVACMSTDPMERPRGEQIIRVLQTIHRECMECEGESTNTTANQGLLSDSLLPSSQEAGLLMTCDACKEHNCCRVSEDGYFFCVASCWKTVQANKFVTEEYSKQSEIAEQQNKILELLSETILPSLSRLEAKAIHPIPRLFIIVPRRRDSHTNIFKTSKRWLLGRVQQRLHLHFVCAHSAEPVGPPIKLAVTREWVRKVAPALVLSLRVLSLVSATVISGLGLDGVGQSVYDSIQMEHVIGIADDLEEMLRDDGDAAIVNRIKSDQLNDDDIKRLNMDCLGLVAERAMRNPGWKEELVRVRRKDEACVLWVKKQYAVLPEYEPIVL